MLFALTSNNAFCEDFEVQEIHGINYTEETFPKVVIIKKGSITTRYYYYNNNDQNKRSSIKTNNFDQSYDAIEVLDGKNSIFYENPDLNGTFQKWTVKKNTDKGYIDATFTKDTKNGENPQITQYREIKNKSDYNLAAPVPPATKPMSFKQINPGCEKLTFEELKKVADDHHVEKIVSGVKEDEKADERKKLLKKQRDSQIERSINKNCEKQHALISSALNEIRPEDLSKSKNMECIYKNFPNIWGQLVTKIYNEPELWSCDEKSNQLKIEELPLKITLSKNELNLKQTRNLLQVTLLSRLIETTQATPEEKAIASNCNPDYLKVDDRDQYLQGRNEFDELKEWFSFHHEKKVTFFSNLARNNPTILPCTQENQLECKNSILKLHEEIIEICNKNLIQKTCDQMKTRLSESTNKELQECTSDYSHCIYHNIEYYLGHDSTHNDSKNGKIAEENINSISPSKTTSSLDGMNRMIASNQNIGGSLPFYSSVLDKISDIVKHSEVINAEPKHITQNGYTLNTTKSIAIAGNYEDSNNNKLYSSSGMNLQNIPMDQIKTQIGKLNLNPPSNNKKPEYTLSSKMISNSKSTPQNKNSKLITTTNVKPEKVDNSSWLKQLLLSQADSIEKFLSTTMIAEQLEHFNIKVKLIKGNKEKVFGPKTASEEWVVARNAPSTTS